MWTRSNVHRMSVLISTIWLRIIRSNGLALPGKFSRRSGADQRLLLEAFCLLAIARFAIFAVPFRRIAPWLGQMMVESPPYAPKREGLIEQVSNSIQTAARYTPWESKCLAQAMAAKMMLKWRNIPSTLYLGVAKDVKTGVKAHAWLRCGDRILTGSQNHKEFTVIACFAENCE